MYYQSFNPRALERPDVVKAPEQYTIFFPLLSPDSRPSLENH